MQVESGEEPSAESGGRETHRRRVRTVFDVRAEDYARHREAQPGFQRQARWMLEAVGGPGPWRLLEVGCGSGSLLAAARRRGFDHVGIDISPAMTRNFALRARELQAPARAACADAESLPFHDASFDAVLALGAMEYMADPAAFAREAVRVLRPGGRLVLSIPSSISPHAIAAECFARLPKAMQRRLLGHDLPAAGERIRRRAVRLGRLKRELRRAGFQPRRWRFSRFVFFPLDRLLPGISEGLATALEPLGAAPVLCRLGAQILLVAVRAPTAPGESA